MRAKRRDVLESGWMEVMMKDNRPKTKVDELRESLEKRRRHDEVTEADETISEGNTSTDSDMDAELTTAKEEAKTHYDKLLRVMADFENYRKRSERDKQEFARYANEELMREMLTALDHLDQALAHIKQSATTDAQNLAMGVELVAKELVNSLEKFGLKAIDAVGKPFDPRVHEALQMVDVEDVAPGTVVAQHRRGYMVNDRLLRAALVDVVKEG